MKRYLNKLLFALGTAGILAVASAFWDTKTLKVRVDNLEKNQATYETTAKTTDQKIDQIYWYLIERNGIKVPKR